MNKLAWVPSLAIAVLDRVATVVSRSSIADAIPAGVPTDAAGSARDPPGGALAITAELPKSAAQGLLDAARSAFTEGLAVVAMASAVLLVLLAVVVGVALQQQQRSGDQDGATEAA